MCRRCRHSIWFMATIVHLEYPPSYTYIPSLCSSVIVCLLGEEENEKIILDLSRKQLKKVPKQEEAQNVRVLLLDENELQKIDNIDSYLKIEKVSQTASQCVSSHFATDCIRFLFLTTCFIFLFFWFSIAVIIEQKSIATHVRRVPFALLARTESVVQWHSVHRGSQGVRSPALFEFGGK